MEDSQSKCYTLAIIYHPRNLDYTLFLKKQNGKITALITYVCDMVVTENDKEEMKSFRDVYEEGLI